MKFYIFENLRFISDFAYGEEVKPINRGEPDYCPVCRSPLSMMKWLPPHRVKLEKPVYGDFVFGTFTEMLVSESFKDVYEKSEIRGITAFHPVEIVKVNRLRPNSPKPPQYYYIEIKRTETKIDEVASHFFWERKPKCSECRSGVIKSLNSVFIKSETWTGEDIFYAKGLPGIIIVSQKFVDFVLENGFTNAKFIPSEDYQESWP